MNYKQTHTHTHTHTHTVAQRRSTQHLDMHRLTHTHIHTHTQVHIKALVLLSDTLLQLDSPELVAASSHITSSHLSSFLFLTASHLYSCLVSLFLPHASSYEKRWLPREAAVSPHLSPPHTFCLPTPVVLAQTLLR
jgi:hypothetical protein